MTHNFHLHPMSEDETVQYIYAKLNAAGSLVPEFIFPEAACKTLWQASGGWPGILDRIALLALANAKTLPVSTDAIERPSLPTGTWDDAVLSEVEAVQHNSEAARPPKLYVSTRGSTMQEYVFDRPRLIIGRTEHNDLAIPSRFVSRHHALLVRHGGATFLMDLNSSNGTFVNSKRVSNHVLANDDVIAIGHHTIKFSDPHAIKRGSLDGVEFADTVVMKTLADMRSLLAQENTALLPAASENLPTAEK